MRTVLVLALAAWTLFAADGVREGHEGNDHYEAGAYPAAMRAYGSGLAERDRHQPSALTSALWNNLGLALFRADSTQQAFATFQKAFATAPDSVAAGRAAFNFGTAAAQSGHDEAALGRLRQALLKDPTHEEARYNFEVVKRRLDRKKQQKEDQQQQQQNQPPRDLQPSPFAERLKSQADSLVARRQYADAFQLMQRGLQRDSTVGAFQSFIQRTSAVAQIDTLSTSPSTSP